jgi:hypothetical protein
MTVISVEITTLQEQTNNTSLSNQDELLGLLTEARELVHKAAEEEQSGEPALVIDGLRQGKAKLQEYGKLLQQEKDNHPDLARAAERLARRIDRLLERYRAWVRKLIGDLLLRQGKSFYVRNIADRKALGPPVREDDNLQVYLRVWGRAGEGSDIDDLTATCGIWICVGDSCLCTEWECEGDGPGGSFP